MVDSNTEDPADYRRGGYHPTYEGETFLSRYSALRKLGWGQFSTVWLCKDTKLDTLVALKIQKSAPDYTQAGLDETDLLVYISKQEGSHKHLVKMLHSFMHRGPNGKHVCMVFELLGETLLELLKSTQFTGLPLDICKNITKQVLQGLNDLHKTCELIHTDIKPENVMVKLTDSDKENCYAKALSMDSEVKIVDLGNACPISRHHTPQIQTRQYRAPEVILGVPYNETADIWSLACTVFELVTGKLLFDPQDTEASSKDEDHLKLMVETLGPLPDEWGVDKLRGLHQSQGLQRRLVVKHGLTEEDAERIESFLRPMLAFLPENRPSAQQCLEHPWLA